MYNIGLITAVTVKGFLFSSFLKRFCFLSIVTFFVFYMYFLYLFTAWYYLLNVTFAWCPLRYLRNFKESANFRHCSTINVIVW